MNLIQLINQDHFNCLINMLNVVLMCQTKIRPEYLPRLPLILKSLMDVCLERLEGTIMLFLRNTYLTERGKSSYDFALGLVRLLNKKIKMLAMKCEGILPFFAFKCLRLISVCQLHKECLVLQQECEFVLTYVHDYHRKRKRVALIF